MNKLIIDAILKKLNLNTSAKEVINFMDQIKAYGKIQVNSDKADELASQLSAKTGLHHTANEWFKALVKLVG